MSTQTSNSSMSRITSSTPSSEESGWSTYIDEFLTSSQMIREEAVAPASASASTTTNYSFSSSISSDATSRCCVTLKRKRTDQCFDNHSKSKAAGEATSDIIDDHLEDTATSFCNNKANQVFSQLDMMKPSKKYNKENITQEKNTKSMEVKSEGRDDKDKECSELRKRGLCLVPVSMLLEHLG